MADIKISQIGQQTATLPFYDVAVNGKRYMIGCDGGNVMTFKSRGFMKNLDFADELANKFVDVADADIKAALGLGVNLETTLDSRFPPKLALGDGFVFVTGFDRTTDWAAGNPTAANTKTSTAGVAGSGGSGGSAGGSGNQTVFTAPDTTTTVEAFLSKYWWAVLLVVVALLWKPIIAPALGIAPKRRRYSR